MFGPRLKDPDAIEFIAIDFAPYLGADTISTATWSVAPTTASPLTIVSDSETTTVATAKVSGGLLGETYTLTCRVVTAGGVTVERSVALRVGQT